MGACGADILVRSVGTGDGKAQPGHGLGQQPAATADIQQRKPFKEAQRAGVAPEMDSCLGAYETQPYRVEFVQGRELARRIPPFRGNSREFGHFAWIYRRGY